MPNSKDVAQPLTAKAPVCPTNAGRTNFSGGGGRIPSPWSWQRFRNRSEGEVKVSSGTPINLIEFSNLDFRQTAKRQIGRFDVVSHLS
jgi:hypothetical protein